jgi:hypothetical protein
MKLLGLQFRDFFCLSEDSAVVCIFKYDVLEFSVGEFFSRESWTLSDGLLPIPASTVVLSSTFVRDTACDLPGMIAAEEVFPLN